MISEPHPGNITTNEMDYNAEKYCLGTNLIVLVIKERTTNVYPYNNSYEPIYNVLIVTSASTYTNINTGRSFIIFIHESLYYIKKLGRYLINTNQLRSYGIMVWDNPFDSNRELCVETEDGNTIGLIENGTRIGFYSIAPTEHEL